MIYIDIFNNCDLSVWGAFLTLKISEKNWQNKNCMELAVLGPCLGCIFVFIKEKLHNEFIFADFYFKPCNSQLNGPNKKQQKNFFYCEMSPFQWAYYLKLFDWYFMRYWSLQPCAGNIMDVFFLINSSHSLSFLLMLKDFKSHGKGYFTNLLQVITNKEDLNKISKSRNSPSWKQIFTSNSTKQN